MQLKLSIKMNKGILLFVLTIIAVLCPQSLGCKGCVNLDDSSFTKIVPHFEVVLVKFDVAFPYGDKHETFTKLATELVDNKQILLAEVGVKDYGEKDNEDFAKKFGVTKDDFPALKLFKQGEDKPITFPALTDFTLDNLRSFIRDNTNIYLGLPGCLENYDKLATKFLETKDHDSVLQEAEKQSESLDEKEKVSAKMYIVIMKKILESGKSFVSQEVDRVSKLLKGKISSKKHTELQSKLNILRAFSIPRKEEL